MNCKISLKSIVERIIRLEEHKASIASDIKELYVQASNQSLDVKSLRQFIKLYQKQADDDMYSGQVQCYKQIYEDELREMFKSDPERLKREHFHIWIQWANK